MVLTPNMLWHTLLIEDSLPCCMHLTRALVGFNSRAVLMDSEDKEEFMTGEISF